MNHIVFDLEWNTGISGHGKVINNTFLSGEIIQIGAVKLDEDFNDVDTFDIRISPKYYTSLNRNVADITNISEKTMMSGVPFTEGIDEFFKWCGDDYTFYTWGPSDIYVLNQNMRLHGLDTTAIKETVDLQKLFAIQILENDSCMSLTNAIDFLEEETFDAHDALNDADSTATVMMYLDLENKNDVSESIVGDGSYLRQDDFAMLYRSADEVIHDMNVRTFVSPITGEKVQCGQFYSEEIGKMVSLAHDRSGNDYYIKLRVKKMGKKYKASRTVYKCTEKLAVKYAEIIEMNLECERLTAERDNSECE